MIRKVEDSSGESESQFAWRLAELPIEALSSLPLLSKQDAALDPPAVNRVMIAQDI